jgi:hypothetical protein
VSEKTDFSGHWCGNSRERCVISGANDNFDKQSEVFPVQTRTWHRACRELGHFRRFTSNSFRSRAMALWQFLTRFLASPAS